MAETQQTGKPPSRVEWQPEEMTSRGSSGITMRGILLGAVFAFLINYLDAYATTMIRGS